ncbi:MAG: aldolase/citrate lyase family protein, partial [Eubacteriales bacterium]|nr:aldolase/citrate lyase family protein [Eubacteriales bacterium]
MLDNIIKKLKEDKPVFGVVSTMLDYTVSEMLACAGFDFIWIDMEHSALCVSDVQMHMIAASGRGAASFVRVPWNDPVMVKPILEMGPDAIIFPLIKNAEDARKAVSSCEYPPKGIRGFGPRRAIRYGMDDSSDYIRDAGKKTWKILQVELAECVENLDEIASV